MEHIDQSPRVDMYAPSPRPSILRWVMRITLAVCGLMIMAVLLSQPRAAAYVQGGFDKVNDLLATFMSDKDQPEQVAPIEITDVPLTKPASATKAAASPKPVVMSMPTSRVPVRRLGLSRED
ncbi:MAG: hypothetical protein JKY94_03320 [Rhodobacteraceae bacterium]|nr:hypothetical protein [Paracoccaceae bacterium]